MKMKTKKRNEKKKTRRWLHASAISTGLVVEKSRWQRIFVVTQGDHQDHDNEDDDVECDDGDDENDNSNSDD